MSKRKPYAVYRLLDSEPHIALIRFDGDLDVFSALATKWLADEGLSYAVQPPEPRLYRMNVCFDDEYGWTLGKPDRPGPGVFLGAVVSVGSWIGGAS